MKRAVVIGAGVGGLTTAALLAKAGVDVTVLEAHIYPGGSAGTFFYQGFRFDAGATLAGGFGSGGPMDLVRRKLDLPAWPARPASLAMRVHLPDGQQVDRWADERRWQARQEAFGSASFRFWQWQEQTADSMWLLAARNLPWPPNRPIDWINLIRGAGGWLRQQGLANLSPGMIADGFRSISHHLRGAPDSLRLFIDAQLLIAAQAIAADTVALYGAAALDLPRRGLMHFDGGMVGIARHLERSLLANGGRILYRHRAVSIEGHDRKPIIVRTERHGTFPAETVIANLTPPNLAELLEAPKLARLQNTTEKPVDGWGAFTSYLGVDDGILKNVDSLHHQIISSEPLSEGNSVFLSLSPAWDRNRAPEGMRAITLSTHTRIEPWWRLFRQDRSAYEVRKEKYNERMLQAAERAFPGISDSVQLQLPGTPVTFQRFTKRSQGWVGGFPQTNLFRAWPSRLADNLFLVGDSIFPGQSTAAVAMGGLRVGHQVLASLSRSSDTENKRAVDFGYG